jgi:polygalacturonase
LSVEPGGDIRHPLHIFVNPPEHDAPNPQDSDVIYFGPGTHEASGVGIEDGQTVYIAGGAVVSLKPEPPLNEIAASASAGCYGLDLSWGAGLFAPRWKKHVTVRGRGILCGRHALAQGRRGPLAVFEGCEDVTVEDIIIRESSVWSLNLSNCTRARVSNVKIVGHYVNNDGIAIGGTSEAVVEDCFTHNADDSLEVKVWIPQRNVLFRNCVVWNDAGQSLGLACETDADIENVAFEHCTVLHSTDDIASRGVIGLHLVGRGSARGFRFEDITIEDVRGPRRPALKVFNNWDDWHPNYPTLPDSPYELLNPPTRAQPNGSIRDVLFRNVRVLQNRNNDVVLMADAAASPIDGITFDDVWVAGQRLEPGDPRIKINAWVTGVEVR